MKKLILTFVFAAAFTTVSAQTETEKTATNTDYNKWSIELAAGVNKPQRPMTSGYFTSTPSPYVVDLGARYMFNNKFGLKADFGYNSFEGKDESKSFDTKYYRVDLQAVANLGRIMNFETWTNTIGLLGHAGFGLSMLEREDPSYVKDRMGNFMAGVTGQIKLTDRISLTGDFTTILNAAQNAAFDGASTRASRGFQGILFNGTVGLTVYLGKNAKHADWVTLVDKDVLALTDRVDNIENKMLDTDNDGVADYLDQEANTPDGMLVDTKGRSIDKNNNNVPDETEAYILKNYGNKSDTTTVYDNELIKSLINGGYVAVYFDFDKSTPTNVSTEGTDFILTYLRNNPSASVDIIGHADELGRTAYNDKLSNARATNVKNTLVKANVDASRLNVIAAGEDTSVDKDSDAARKLVRKVTFRVK
jgi:OOP family OmpA-OmpF porin